jgi:hypothetical protein
MLDLMPGACVYTIEVHTGDVRHAGTDANVHLNMHGPKGSSSQLALSHSNHRNKFERAQVDVFSFELKDLGVVETIEIGHDGMGIGSGWFLDKVVVRSGELELRTFYAHRWLDVSEGDSRVEIQLSSSANLELQEYRVDVVTGDVKHASTDASVRICFFGSDGKSSGKRFLERSNHSHKFRRGQIDTFHFMMPPLGELVRLKIGHDAAAVGAGWFLQEVRVMTGEIGVSRSWVFIANAWLDVGVGVTETELFPGSTSYTISVLTGDVRFAGTDADVSLMLWGSKAASGVIPLRNSDHLNKFERAQTDTFKVELQDLGEIQRLMIGHDGSKPGAGWYLDRVMVRQTDRDEQVYMAVADRWLDSHKGDGKIEIELPCKKQAGMRSYHISVTTGDVRYAGTDANVRCQLVGSKSTSALLYLQKSNHTNKFERGQTDTFHFDLPGLGELVSLRIGHDGFGPGSGWYCDKVAVRYTSARSIASALATRLTTPPSLTFFLFRRFSRRKAKLLGTLRSNVGWTGARWTEHSRWRSILTTASVVAAKQVVSGLGSCRCSAPTLSRAASKTRYRAEAKLQSSGSKVINAFVRAWIQSL